MASKWNTYRLDEVGKIVTGKTPSSKVENAFTSNGIPFITPRDMDGRRWISSTERYLSTDGVDAVKKSLVPAGTVAVSCIGSDMGKAVLLPSKSVTNQQINSLIVDSDRFNPLYIYYVLSTKQDLLKSIASGSATPILNKTHFGQVEIVVPEKHIQDWIVAQLDPTDSKVELNRQTNQTLEQLAQALFKSWFVDFDPVFDNALDNGVAVSDFPEVLQKKAQQRFEQRQQFGSAENDVKPLPADILKVFPSEFEQTDEPSIGINGWIPKGWVLSNTDEEFGIKGGSTPSTKNPDFWEGGEIHWTSPKDLSGNDSKILLDTSRKITEAGLAKITSGLLPIDTVLMSSRAPVGYLALAKVPVAINQGYIALRCEKTLSPEYTMQFLESVMDEIKGISGGTTFAEISKKTFRSIKLIVPTKSVVDAYTKIAKAQYDKITANIKQSNALTDTRDYLLPKLISGELPLSTESINSDGSA